MCGHSPEHPRAPTGSPHPEVIARWWRAWPQANVAIRTGALPSSATRGVVVLDVDPLHGGEESLDHLLATNGRLPPTRMVHTGSGGRHLYFAHPGGSVRNSAGTAATPAQPGRVLLGR
ncbi:MAG: bifunctional DNA primase/polymerase [Acidimicrobiales bacterium]